MISEASDVSSPKRRKFPINCVECGRKEVFPAVIEQRVERNHDGRIYEFNVDRLPVVKCRSCGEVYYSLDSDDRIVEALRRHLSLLTPARILANLEALQMTQKQAAQGLGIAPETMSRWLTGMMVQSRAMDNLLRAFFASPEVRAGLMNAKRRKKFGESVPRANRRARPRAPVH